MKKNSILALSTALLLWLAWPPMSFTAPLLLIAFVPLLSATENIILSDSASKGKKIFLLSFAAFFIWNTSCVYWVFNSVNSVMPAWIAALISLIPFGLAALLMAIAFWLYYQVRKVRSKVWSYVALICFWMTYEYLHQSWDLAFPWMTLGNGFAETHRLIQWYEYTGVYGGSLWILVANILAFEIGFQNEESKEGYALKKKLSFILTGWVLIPITLSLIIYSSYKEPVNPANIVVVQPNIDPYGKWHSIPASEQISRLIQLSDSVAKPNTEYFIWPETSIPDYVDEATVRSHPNFLKVQDFLSKYKNGNVLAGIESYALYSTAKTPSAQYNARFGMYIDYFNAAINIENSARVQFYHKSKLVPGVEQMPFANTLRFMKPLFAAFGGSTGGFGSQKEPSVFFSQSGVGVGPVICYESIWGGYVAGYVKKGAQFIAIITNDGWWGNTSGKDQHMAYAKLRAVETRRWVARSANTGISAFINQKGDITQRSGWWVQTALNADINLNDEITFYVRYGDYLAWIACIGTGAFAVILLYKGNAFRRKKKANG